jgi:proteasome lid subunit RPN8/RPN11
VATHGIRISSELVEELKAVCVRALPGKAYGLIGGRSRDRPTTIYPCRTNLRSRAPWRRLFEARGDFYRDPDRGFVIDPLECRKILGVMERNGREGLVGVYHSHRCRRAEPSPLDAELHFDPSVVCYIVSVREPERPEVRAYRIADGRTRETPIQQSRTEARRIAC